MSKSRKPRRSYDPGRWLRQVMQVQQRRHDAAPIGTGQAIDIGIACNLSLERMRQGGDEPSWHTLAQALNLSLVLCEQGIGPEYEASIIAGQEALVRIQARRAKTGSWAMDAEARQAIERSIDVHEAHLASCTQGEIRRAIGIVNRRIAAGQVFEVAEC